MILYVSPREDILSGVRGIVISPDHEIFANPIRVPFPLNTDMSQALSNDET